MDFKENCSVIDTGGTDSTGYPDDCMAAGTLMLLDFTHSVSPVSGVPINNQILPNIAAPQAAAMIGSGDVNPLGTLGALFQLFGTLGVDLLLERSGKGGLHAICSQVNNTVNNKGALLRNQDTIKTHLLAHASDNWYFCIWDCITRVPITSSPHYYASINNTSVPGANALAYFRDDSMPPEFPVPGTATWLGSKSDPTPNALGPHFRDVAASGWTGTVPGAIANLNAHLSDFGNSGAAFATNKAPSRIFYRVGLENLTVSNRNAADAHAAYFKAYTREVMLPGGKFYGDTYTDPATFP